MYPSSISAPDNTRQSNLTHLSFDKATTSKQFGNITVDNVLFGENKLVSRLTCKPGFKWSTDVKPHVRTNLCEHTHIGYKTTGDLLITSADGSQHTLHDGDVYLVPPQHDAENLGDTNSICLDINYGIKVDATKTEHASFNEPNHVKRYNNCELETLQLSNGITFMREKLYPGFLYSRDIGIPHFQKDVCEHEHMGILLQGELHVMMNNGEEYVIKSGEAFHILPNHDVRVHGNEMAMMIHCWMEQKNR